MRSDSRQEASPSERLTAAAEPATIRPRGDGDDPPHPEPGSKTGYPVVSRGGDDDPPHPEPGSKTGYPVVSRGGDDPPHPEPGSKTGYPVVSEG